MVRLDNLHTLKLLVDAVGFLGSEALCNIEGHTIGEIIWDGGDRIKVGKMHGWLFQRFAWLECSLS